MVHSPVSRINMGWEVARAFRSQLSQMGEGSFVPWEVFPFGQVVEIVVECEEGWCLGYC